MADRTLDQFMDALREVVRDPRYTRRVTPMGMLRLNVEDEDCCPITAVYHATNRHNEMPELGDWAATGSALGLSWEDTKLIVDAADQDPREYLVGSKPEYLAEYNGLRQRMLEIWEAK
jgi:hypothetical protein